MYESKVNKEYKQSWSKLEGVGSLKIPNRKRAEGCNPHERNKKIPKTKKGCIGLKRGLGMYECFFAAKYILISLQKKYDLLLIK